MPVLSRKTTSALKTFDWRRLVLSLPVGITLCLANAAHAADSFLPLAVPATNKAMPGKFVYAQLTTPDIVQAERFYGQLLGWTFKESSVSVGRYVQATVNGKSVAGLVERPLDGRHTPLWLPFISTASVDQLVVTAKTWGGSIMFAPHDIPGIGREAIISDAQGGLFAAVQSSSGDPEDSDAPAVQGQWIWNALLTRAPRDATGFYQKLFSYEVRTQDESQGPLRYILSSQASARATVNPLPPRLSADAPARWISFINVDNVAESAKKAVELGGSVISEPHLDHNNSMIAILADPAGAVFGVMEAQASVDGEAK